MRARFRLLPILIFSAVLLLSVRVGGLWDNLSVEVGGVSVAETKPAAGAQFFQFLIKDGRIGNCRKKQNYD